LEQVKVNGDGAEWN